MIYALHPQCSISIHQLWGLKQQNTVFAVASPFLTEAQNQGGRTDAEIRWRGHDAAGTCQVSNEKATDTLAELIKQINLDG